MSELVGDARHLSPPAQEALRLRAVTALVEGHSRGDVAEMFRVSLKAVDGWWAKWQAGGREALAAQPRGKRVGDHQLMSQTEQQAVRQAILDHRPCDLGLNGQLWTRDQIGVLIANLHQVRLTEPGVSKYLHRWGLSFQRPDKRATGQEADAVRCWREKIWPTIRAKAKNENAQALFVDQISIHTGRVTGGTPGENDRPPALPHTANRFSANGIAAITSRGQTHFMVHTGQLDTRVLCRFLERVTEHFGKRIHLIVDSHPTHHSPMVQDWTTVYPDRIELHYLPTRPYRSAQTGQPVRAAHTHHRHRRHLAGRDVRSHVSCAAEPWPRAIEV
ncbi:IS630 family transposase [Streptomyces sp. V4I8]|uniref:IS630 family transposase n=1 Tax=Streptomyces sp. V4I8 TaxID=3156469 RepID=UPI003518A521